MKSKKSTISIDVMIYMAIGVIVFLVLVFIVPNLLGRGGRETCNLLSSSRDYDGDRISDFFDKCPCDQGTEDYDGCTNKELNPETPKEDCKEKIEEDCKKT